MTLSSSVFTTRPELAGTFGMVSSTHWIASAVAFAMLEKGGNAFDAAAAGGFVLHVVEPHLNGPGGDANILIYSAREGRVQGICGQGVAPKAATIDACRSLGLDLIPGDGLLAAVVPGAFDAWMLLLRDYGSLPLGTVLQPAIDYAKNGHPILAGAADAIADRADFFRREWPTSAERWLRGNRVPAPGSLVANEPLAATWLRLLAEARGGSREAEIDAARAIFSKGFIAEAIGEFVATTRVSDASGGPHSGFLTVEDIASWQASYEEPLAIDYHDARVFKLGIWSQGPVLLQALSILEGVDVAAMDPVGPDFIHWVVESLKLALADREAYYGDRPDQHDVARQLLSESNTKARRALVGRRASFDFRPSVIGGLEAEAELAVAIAQRALSSASESSEPTFGHLVEAKGRGDTCHIDVVDRAGNMVSATPSGGWLQSSPTIPALGFALGTRAQMFRLDPGSPAVLGPGRRPRTTLTPSLVLLHGKPWLACGTPGGDTQDQWQLIFLLHVLHHGMNLQQAIDCPLFYSEHAPLSFWPRGARPGHVRLEGLFPPETISALEQRGHIVTVDPPWTIGRLCAVAQRDGVLRAAATPRFMQAYAVGR
jgi:gamma-glutamyltranspeptidase/glutathione hydrolase